MRGASCTNHVDRGIKDRYPFRYCIWFPQTILRPKPPEWVDRSSGWDEKDDRFSLFASVDRDSIEGTENRATILISRLKERTTDTQYSDVTSVWKF